MSKSGSKVYYGIWVKNDDHPDDGFWLVEEKTGIPFYTICRSHAEAVRLGFKYHIDKTEVKPFNEKEGNNFTADSSRGVARNG
jgi:hypothetical protein